MPQWNQRLSQALRADPGKPRLTWYDGDSQRVELSGAVLDNWADKTANLLLDEVDAGPGTRIGLDLPLHWRTACWAVGIWRTGACVVTDPTSGTDVLVTTRPADHPSHRGTRIAVALPPLARAFDGPLAGAVDSAATLLAQPDALGPVVPPAPDDPALADPTTTLDYQTLTAHPASSPHRVLRTADPATPVRLTDLLGLDVLADGGSLVLITTDHPATAPGPARDRLVTAERITTVEVENSPD
ncbi:MAG: TIGR03089 family protein [Micrococcales bacterium]|nr:TIGR03089 family protein [Micrococcales bacterium]